MAALPVTLDGVLYDIYGRTTQRVLFIGDASLTGVGIGGGPVIPPPGGPVHIWGPTDPRPTPPIAFPPGWVGGVPPVLPVPPDVTVPPPGSPPVILPGTTPTHPITPPPAIVVEYPGVGKIVVPQPVAAAPPPAKK